MGRNAGGMASPIRPFVCQTVTDMYRLIKIQNTDKDGQDLMLGSICTCEGNPRASKRRVKDDVQSSAHMPGYSISRDIYVLYVCTI